jgi:hypothetical protein
MRSFFRQPSTPRKASGLKGLLWPGLFLADLEERYGWEGPRTGGAVLPGRNDSSVFFEHEFVHVAPHPIFAGLDGADDRVLGGVKVLGGVLIFGRIAAADVAAD